MRTNFPQLFYTNSIGHFNKFMENINTAIRKQEKVFSKESANVN